jgi:ubiquinone/menaquinone biosynthesis C-methylase UbiE
MDSKLKKTIQTYDRTVHEYTKNVADLHPKEVSINFLEHIPPGGNILDLGCGSGRDALIFSQGSYQVTGIDLSRGMIEHAKIYAPLATFYQMDMRRLDFKNQSFDGVWAVASLLHLSKRDISTCLSECNRVLKDRGIIYVGVKKGVGEEFKPDLRYDGEAYKFYSYFSEEEITSSIKNAGFDILTANLTDRQQQYLKHSEIRVLGRKK